jgi:two-component system KDP operon response regulator KdpE
MNREGREKILVVDDDIQIQRALRLALVSRGYTVILASDGDEALDLAALETPELMILDLTLPGINGIDVCKETRKWSKIPIIVLSVKDKEQDKVLALDAGADDYITKPFMTGELLARIRAHLRRVSQGTEEKAEYEIGKIRVNFAHHLAYIDNDELKLTKTEFSLLHYLVKNAGRVVTYNLLLSNMWGSDMECDLQTLRVHIANLRKKIEPEPNRPKYILTESGVGYRFASNA